MRNIELFLDGFRSFSQAWRGSRNCTTARTSAVLFVLSLHARCKLQPLQPAALPRGYVERWSLHCSQPQPLLYTRNPALWKTKEGDKQPPRDQSFQRLFVMMLEPEARRDTLDFLEDGHEMGFSVHVTTRAPVDWIKC